MAYRPRIIDRELQERLGSAGGIVLEGPKACGKTATARQFAASEVLLDVDAEARQALLIDPTLILKGKTPRLLDEWQVAPALWNYVRRAIDDRGQPGQFLLTGSAVPADDITRHSGAGRMARIRLRPMSLFEMGYASGEVALRALLQGDMPSSPATDLSLLQLAERLAVGGWPRLLDFTPKQALLAVQDYVEEVRRVDLRQMALSRLDPLKIGQLLRSLARHVATYASMATLVQDCAGDEIPLKEDAIHGYLTALERLMLVENQPPWAPHLRSKSRQRRTSKRHFVDPSLAVAALRATPSRLLNDLNFFGLLFESMVVRDLRIYAQANDASVFQYRDNTGLEVDIVVEAAEGHWAAFEVKLGAGMLEQAAANLLKFAARVDLDKCGAPRMLGVIVATGYAYRRHDGVAVIPIGTLGP